ncbi:hypothetical protein GCM10009853_029820 [Glycomyces scopariae]
MNRIRNALAATAALAVVLGLAGLHVKRPRAPHVPHVPHAPRKKGGSGADAPTRHRTTRTPVHPPMSKVHKAARAKAVSEGRVKVHADGSLRTKDGKYAGSDGRVRSGEAAENRVLDRLGRRHETAPKGPGAAVPSGIKGEVLSGPNKGKFDVPPGTQRFYDGFVKIGDKWYGVETKSGSAKRTPQQRAIDDWLNKPGNKLTTSDGREIHGVITYNE